jgi:hypothetical protein
LFSGIRVSLIAKLNHNVQAFSRGEGGVETCIRFVGILEAGENLHRLFHT